MKPNRKLAWAWLVIGLINGLLGVAVGHFVWWVTTPDSLPTLPSGHQSVNTEDSHEESEK